MGYGMTNTVGIKIDEGTKNRLKALGEIRRRSPHWLMKEAISKYLDYEEEIERRNQEANEAWEEYQKTGRYVKGEDMIAWLDTWGTDKEKPCPKISNRN